MKSQSLKFFPRETKLSNAEELLMSDFNLVNKEKVANQRLESFAVYIMILMKMSEDDDRGYFLEYSQDNRQLLARKIGTDNKFLHKVVCRCLERGLFDKAMFEKYNILTSADIQDKYFFAKQRCTKLRVVIDYLYDFIYEDYKNVLKKSIYVNKNGEIVNKNSQTTQDETNTETKTETQTEKDTTTNATPTVSASLSKFMALYPEKCRDLDKLQIPDYVNLDKLIQKIQESSFLPIASNLDLAWCCRQENYDKIMRGDYEKKNFRPKVEHNMSKRTYTQEELNAFMSDIETVEI